MGRESAPLQAVPPTPTAEELCAGGAMTFSQASSFCGLSRRTLYVLVDEGRLHRIRIGGRVLISRRELVQLLAEGFEE